MFAKKNEIVQRKVSLAYLLVLLFSIWSVAFAEESLDKIKRIENEKVRFVWEVWANKYREHQRHILLITDENIIDIKMPEILSNPTYSKVGIVEIKNESIDGFLELFIYIMKNPLDVYGKKEDIQKSFDLLKRNLDVKSFVGFIADVYSKTGEVVVINDVYSYKEFKTIRIIEGENDIKISFKLGKIKWVFVSEIVRSEQTEKVFMELTKIFGIYTSVESVSKNFSAISLFNEFYGDSMLPSINVDYRFLPNWSFRSGFGFFLYEIHKFIMLSMPITMSYLTGLETSHHLELGISLMVLFIKGSKGWLGGVSLPLFTMGYRYQPKDGGLFFKISFTPQLLSVFKEDILPSFGLSIGHTF